MGGYAVACIAGLVFASLCVPFWFPAVVPSLHCACFLCVSVTRKDGFTIVLAVLCTLRIPLPAISLGCHVSPVLGDIGCSIAAVL